MAPLQERRRHFEAHPDEVRDILEEGNKRAREQARETMAAVREAIGFNLPCQKGKS